MGRPKKPIDAAQVEKLAKLGCTQEEIAEFFGVGQATISTRFRSEFARARADWKMSLRRAQTHRAVKARSDTMLIHLGKVYLGQAGTDSLSDIRDVLSGLLATKPDPPGSE